MPVWQKKDDHHPAEVTEVHEAVAPPMNGILPTPAGHGGMLPAPSRPTNTRSNPELEKDLANIELQHDISKGKALSSAPGDAFKPFDSVEVQTMDGIWLPATIRRKVEGGYRVAFLHDALQTVGEQYLRHCQLQTNQAVEIFAQWGEWLPGTIANKSLNPQGYSVKFNGEDQQIIGTSCIRPCSLQHPDRVEVWGGSLGWMPGTIISESLDARTSGYVVMYGGNMEGLVGAHFIKRCNLFVGESIEVWADRDGWHPGTVVGISEEPVGYEILYNASTREVVGTHCIRRCGLEKNQSVEVWAGDNGWMPGTIVSKSVNPAGYEVKYNGMNQQVIGNAFIRNCALKAPDSVEVWAGSTHGWLPGTLVEESQKPIGWKVKFLGTQESVVGTYSLKYCSLAPNSCVELYSDEKTGWIPGMIVEASMNPIGYKVRYMGNQESVVGTFSVKPCALFLKESVEIWSGESWLPGTIVEKCDYPVGYKVKFEGNRSEIMCGGGIKRPVLHAQEHIEVWVGEGVWVPAKVVQQSNNPIGYEIVITGQTKSQVVATYTIRRK